MWTIKSVCKMVLILARLNACESRGSALLTIRSGKTFNEQTHRYAAGQAPARLGKCINWIFDWQTGDKLKSGRVVLWGLEC